MRHLRTISTTRLLMLLAATVALALSAGFAQAALDGSDAKPDPKPLDRAILDAVNAPPVDGVSARVTFTNGLLPSGSLPDGAVSPLAEGAEGRLWLAGDGRMRLELQSEAGDAQIVAGEEQHDDLRQRVRDRLPAAGRREARRRARGRAGHASPTCAAASTAWPPPGASPAPSRPRPPAGRPTRSGSRRRTTAACSAPPSWPGTRSTASRCAPPSTPRARTSPCSSSRPTTSPTARSPARRSRPTRPRARASSRSTR